MGRTRANAQSVTGPSLLVPFITAWSTTLEADDGDSGMKSMATLQSVVEALCDYKQQDTEYGLKMPHDILCDR